MKKPLSFYALIFATALMLTGCASNSNTLAKQASQESKAYEVIGKQYSKGEKEAKAGEKLISSGRKLVAEGRTDIKKGENIVYEGNQLIALSRGAYFDETGHIEDLTVFEPVDTTITISKEWEDGITKVKKGNKLIAQGNDKINKGEDRIREGRTQVEYGKGLMKKAENAYKARKSSTVSPF